MWGQEHLGRKHLPLRKQWMSWILKAQTPRDHGYVRTTRPLDLKGIDLDLMCSFPILATGCDVISRAAADERIVKGYDVAWMTGRQHEANRGQAVCSAYK